MYGRAPTIKHIHSLERIFVCVCVLKRERERGHNSALERRSKHLAIPRGDATAYVYSVVVMETGSF